MYDHTFYKLANHQTRHQTTQKVGCQPGDCIWLLQCSPGVCVGIYGLTYSLYHPRGNWIICQQPSKQSRSADGSPTSVQHWTDIGLTSADLDCLLGDCCLRFLIHLFVSFDYYNRHDSVLGMNTNFLSARPGTWTGRQCRRSDLKSDILLVV